MRKLILLPLLIFFCSVIFAGAVSAQQDANVTVTVVDQNDDPVVVACPDDNVTADVVVEANDRTMRLPFVQVMVDPDTGLNFIPQDAMMWDGTQFVQNNLLDPFFYWDPLAQAWIWNIEKVYGEMLPGDFTELLAPATVSDTGDITVDTVLFDNLERPTFIDEDSYTFLSIPCEPNVAGEPQANAATVPMQNTGAPIALAVLALLSIIGGITYGKLR